PPAEAHRRPGGEARLRRRLQGHHVGDARPLVTNSNNDDLDNDDLEDIKMAEATQAVGRRRRTPYDRWMEAQGLPVYRGHFVAEPGTVEVAPWPERGINGAFIQLAGMEGVSEARITEIPPGGMSKLLKIARSDVACVPVGQA